MNHFKNFNLTPSLEKALASMGFNEPTPIQAKAIPVALTGKDLIGCAQTGTGKTAAYCIPTLMRLIAKPNKIALVLAPTRELAEQIEEFWRTLTRFNPEMTCVNIMGGVAMGPQLRALRNRPRFIIATPGRLCDHLNRGTVNRIACSIWVLPRS